MRLKHLCMSQEDISAFQTQENMHISEEGKKPPHLLTSSFHSFSWPLFPMGNSSHSSEGKASHVVKTAFQHCDVKAVSEAT